MKLIGIHLSVGERAGCPSRLTQVSLPKAVVPKGAAARHCDSFPHTSANSSRCALLVHRLELKKPVSVEDAFSAPLRVEDKYPHMVKVLGLMENRCDGT